jgi:outer membrane protein OmpA-like peptidoglycan-associated protein
MNYLKGHRDPLFDVAPENLVEKMIPALGMHELRNMKLTYARKQEEKIAAKKEMKAAEAREEETVSYEEEPSRGGVGKILLILAVIALAGVLGYLIYDSREDLFGKSESQSTEVVVEDLPEVVLDSTSSADTAIVDAHPGVSALVEVLKAPQLDPALEIRLESLAFGPDSSEFREGDHAVVDTLIAEFKRNPRFQIQVRGGDSKGNSQNAIRRAFHLKRLLQNKGVDPIRIDATADSENLDYLKIRVVSK